LQRAPTNAQWIPAIAQRNQTVERFVKPTNDSIPTIVRLFESTTTKQIDLLRNTHGIAIWQKIITSISSEMKKNGSKFEKILRSILQSGQTIKRIHWQDRKINNLKWKGSKKWNLSK
jgi:hypothetical protein